MFVRQCQRPRIGHSFGSVRYSYLGQHPGTRSIEWSVLARPFPVGVDAEAFVIQRAQLTETLFGIPDQKEVPPQPKNRSLAITAFDRLSAVVSLGYVPPGEEQQATGAVIGSPDAETIGRFSDNLWHRYGESSISAAYLAQLDEVCAAMTRTNRLISLANTSSISGIIATMLLPCAGTKPLAPAAKAPGCVVSSSFDPVVAGDLALKLLEERHGEIVAYRSTQASHGSKDGLQHCLEKAQRR